MTEGFESSFANITAQADRDSKKVQDLAVALSKSQDDVKGLQDKVAALQEQQDRDSKRSQDDVKGLQDTVAALQEQTDKDSKRLDALERLVASLAKAPVPVDTKPPPICNVHVCRRDSVFYSGRQQHELCSHVSFHPAIHFCLRSVALRSAVFG